MENQVIKSEELQLMKAKMEQEFALTPVGQMVRSIDAVQKLGEFFAAGTIVPKDFKGNPANCAIAVDLAIRMGMNPMMVMQNMYIVNGTPSLSSQMIIAIINKCGEFEPLEWEDNGKTGDEFGMRAYSFRKSDINHEHRLNGTWITVKMVKSAGWGINWNKYPEQMYKYRSAVYWARLHAPEITMGFVSHEEVDEPSFKFDNAEEVTGQKSLADLALDAALATPKKTEKVVVETPQEELLLTPETESPIEKTLE